MTNIPFFLTLLAILIWAQYGEALNPIVVVTNTSDGSFRLGTEELERLLKDPRVAEKKVLFRFFLPTKKASRFVYFRSH